MPAMKYFRRPTLSGTVLRRQGMASIRGNLRRKNADSVSQYPYFAGISASQTLIVQSDSGGPLAVALPDGRLDHVLTALNNVTTGLPTIGANAFDDGGCVGIRTTTTTGAGFIQVTGGTAATALGFDLTQQTFRATSSDLTLSPEAEIGQPFGTALMGPGENFTTESVSRSIGRVMANTDVLHADLLKGYATLFNAYSTTLSSSTTVFPLTWSLKGWVGAPLQSSSTKEALANFYVIVDNATKQISQSRVIDVTSDSAGNNTLLGGNQIVVAYTNITSIKNGRVVEVAGATFTSNSVIPGDFVSINGASNTTPWSNNGYRWVVEEIIDATHLGLRPMSYAELALVGTSPAEEHPIVELNPGTSGLGQIRISRGPYAANLYLKVSPALPAGSNISVWMASYIQDHAASLHHRVYQLSPLLAQSTANYDVQPNAILSRPKLTVGSPASTITVGPFMARWHGRAIRMPQIVFDYTASANGNYYFYWSEADCTVKSSTVTDFLAPEQRLGTSTEELAGTTPNSASKGKLIGSFTVASHLVSNVLACTRVEASESLSITCGNGAEFPDLASAIEYVRCCVVGNSTLTYSVDIKVTSDQQAPTNGWLIPVDGIRICGGRPTTRLIEPSSGSMFRISFPNAVYVSDLAFDLTKSLVNGDGRLYTSNIHNTSTTLNEVGHSYADYAGNLSLGGVYIGAHSSAVYIGSRLSLGSTNIVGLQSQVVMGPTSGAEVWIKSGTTVLGQPQSIVMFQSADTGATPVSVSYDMMKALTGGTSSNADPYHTHLGISGARAWAKATMTSNGDNTAHSTINSTFGINSVSSTASSLHVGFLSPISDTNYTIHITGSDASGVPFQIGVSPGSVSTSSLWATVYTMGGVLHPITTGDVFNVVIFR